jgi:hypothetical protein
MRIFNIEQSDENIAGHLHTLAFDKLSATEPTAEEVMAAGLLVVLRRLYELSEAALIAPLVCEELPYGGKAVLFQPLHVRLLFGVVRTLGVGVVGHETSERWRPLRRNTAEAACG